MTKQDDSAYKAEQDSKLAEQKNEERCKEQEGIEAGKRKEQEKREAYIKNNGRYFTIPIQF